MQEIIHAYRVRGHLMADTDPLHYEQRMHPDLDVLSHGLTLWDLDREFATGGFAGRPLMKLREILGVLRDSYTRSIGIEYMHIQDPEERAWIQAHVEVPHERTARDEQLRILHKLNQSEAFETFLQTKYVGQKRFSLEGGETTIPLVDEICEAAAEATLESITRDAAPVGAALVPAVPRLLPTVKWSLELPCPSMAQAWPALSRTNRARVRLMRRSAAAFDDIARQLAQKIPQRLCHAGRL